MPSCLITHPDLGTTLPAAPGTRTQSPHRGRPLQLGPQQAGLAAWTVLHVLQALLLCCDHAPVLPACPSPAPPHRNLHGLWGHGGVLWLKQPTSSSGGRSQPESLQAPEGEGKGRACCRQGRAACLTHLRGRPQAQRSDQAEEQGPSQAAAAVSQALKPEDRAEICIRRFTGLTRAGFQGTEKALTHQGPSPTTPAKPHHLGSGTSGSVNLCWIPGGAAPRCLLAPRPQGFKGEGESARYAGAPWQGCRLSYPPDWQHTMPRVMAAGARLVSRVQRTRQGTKIGKPAGQRQPQFWKHALETTAKPISPSSPILVFPTWPRMGL